MNYEELKRVANFITQNLCGKTIAKATALEPWPGNTIIIEFTDGSQCKIDSEYDEGFRFSIPKERS